LATGKKGRYVLLALICSWKPLAMDLLLEQRGRALMDFEVSARRAASALHGQVISEMATKGLTQDTLPDDMNACHNVIDAALADSPTYSARHLLAEWCAQNHGLAAQAAFEDIRSKVAPKLEALRVGPTTLDVLPHFERAPRYYDRTWFHRTDGGWDAGDYNGFVHGKVVTERYLSKVFPGDPERSRQLTLDQLPEHDYRHVLEIGTSSGHFTVSLAKRLANVEIHGVDPSRRMLEQAQRVANEAGLAWKLFVGMGEDTRFEDETYDLVTAYIVHHELPPRIIRALFQEAHRLLRPGGVILFGDVPPYREISRIEAWSFDWVARRHGEPYWRAAASMNMADEAQAAGFADVTAKGVGPGCYPYVVTGRKPPARNL
jgi:SAM-dependent methyltransferase